MAARDEGDELREDGVREQVRLALEATGSAAVLCDRNGDVVAVTPAAQALLGDAALARTEDDLLGRILARATEPRPPVELRGQAIAGGVRIALLEEGEIRLERRELSPRLVLWLFAREADGEGARHRQELLGITSHDFRSPLANIRSYAGMILGGKGPPLDPRVKRAAQVIVKNADRGLRLVDDWIDLKRADEKQLDLERSNVPIEEVLRLAYEDVRTAAADKGVRLHWSVHDGLPILSIDEDKLRRAVRALLEAAVRRTPTDGEVRLVVEARTHEILISVEDEGERPSVRDVALAFDRTHQTLKNRKLAAGISLALAQEVVKGHGGRVGFVPRPSVGASWYIILPR